MKHRWLLKPTGNTETIETLSRELNVETQIAQLLVQRGINTFEEARVFFRPELSDLHDPFLMKDMDKAVERLLTAISNNEKILIYGDYDVDGTTAVAIIYNFLIRKYSNIEYYIPDRYQEGYGISFKGIDYAEEINCKLVIAVDCGIKAVEKTNYANEKNIDLIICDHHTPGPELPKACAVLDPKQGDCNYPYKELSGCGVAFKLMQAYCQKTNDNFAELAKLLDLVVVSIGSDIVPVTGENRILSYFGLLQLNSDPQPGLKSIINISGLENKEIQINDIVFKIGPRINAAGRMESGKTAVELLTSTNDEYANKIAIEIDCINTNRKELDSGITEHALSMISESEISKNAFSTVVYHEEWHKGVIGIVASRLTETYYRPTVVFTKSNGIITGSARSVPGYNLYQAIESCSDLLENFGGHRYAAGLSLKPENLNSFIERFEKYVKETITEEQRTPVINADLEIKIKDITPKFYRILKQFAPFGPENMTPTFITRKVFDNGSAKVVGKENEHLKLKVVQKLGDNRCIEAIGFNFAHYYEHIKEFKEFDVCYQIFENNFMNQKFIQILIKDILTE
ncbi:MAG: single-stranded-DNA-specific exonuclease RecJ [Bacteroidales bacterium]|jgi:single-stranded-DNA-specific exonuclease|nr:single-stranded-DNA-specific exonuclease RecJ [Bacteroidales bacterium]MCK9498868.1 single-stranded-DNA-specific exonuclease RecJ [Bacteroidales bacterium]MDY0314819.1 single-stranded-DNA-specific exonuclease RecJ [Bacteroidales bacterium]NLB85978.1 single-stranded-DNA-specific exonuclease RecJ [Bacteroidales bacterium]